MLACILHSTKNVNHVNALIKKYAWDDAKKEQYAFNLHAADNGFINLYSNLMEPDSPENIDENVSNFVN